ncbi:MAG: response regulator [Anaerolineae bacterium]|nr:response regulator [Anaerolineae bacterium]
MEKKILIVDDEPFIRLLLKQTLEELEDRGVQILEAQDGQEALDVALSERPDLIFLDVMMPHINGFDVCRQVKETCSEIHVILLTARGQSIDEDQGQQVQADQYMTKPFDPDDVIDQAIAILRI